MFIVLLQHSFKVNYHYPFIQHRYNILKKILSNKLNYFEFGLIITILIFLGIFSNGIGTTIGFRSTLAPIKLTLNFILFSLTITKHLVSRVQISLIQSTYVILFPPSSIKTNLQRVSLNKEILFFSNFWPDLCDYFLHEVACT